MQTRLLLACLCAAALALAGCAGTPTGRSPPAAPRPGAPSPGPAPATPGTAPTAGPLAAEVRWMHSLFDGTPVVVEAESDGAMRVDVPLVHAFDKAGAAPRPPLRAVLDRLAQSLIRRPGTQLHLGPPGPAARERLAALRSYLRGKGIAPQRMIAATPLKPDHVLLRMAQAPGAIELLDDRSLPAAPVRPPAAVR